MTQTTRKSRRPPATRNAKAGGARAPLSPSGANGPIKLAQDIAQDIERNIIDRGWTIGENVGNEAQLVERYGVSRWVVREAISIVERDGLAKMRRGRSGGLFVASPAEDAAAYSISNYIESTDVSIDDILEVRHVLERLAMKLACERIDEARVGVLRSLIDERSAQDDLVATLTRANALRRELARAARDPLLEVLLHALSKLVIDRAIFANVYPAHTETSFDTYFASLHRQVEAVIAGNVDVAYREVEKQVETYRDMFARAAARQGNSDRAAGRKSADAIELLLTVEQIGRPPKLSESVAERIRSLIWNRGLKEGDRIGSEAQLLETFQVSRGVLREAIRNLERLSVVQTTRGKGGGLIVCTPSPEATIRSACLYFSFMAVEIPSVFEIGEAIEVKAVELASRRANRNREAVGLALRSVLNEVKLLKDRDPLKAVSRFYEVIGELSGNKVLSFFMALLGRLITLGRDAHKVLGKNSDFLERGLGTLFEAVAQGDWALARRRMLRLRMHGNTIRVHRRPPSDFLPER